jgi:metallo-beta-lactamase family protein
MLGRVRSKATITLLGAAGEVTGSCSLLQTPRGRVVIDFGLFQGTPAQERRNLVVPEIGWSTIDAVVVTHAHVDHCGRIGMLPRLGCDAPILCTPITADLLPKVLKSSANLQALRMDEFREGTAPIARVVDPPPPPSSEPARGEIEPPVLYTAREVERVSHQIRAIAYGTWHEIRPGLRVRLHDASHIIGSASVEIAWDDEGGARSALFSGDLGPGDNPLLRGRAPLPAVDLVVMESTNGARDIPRSTAGPAALGEVIARVQARGGRVLVPTFSLGRAQLVQFRLAELARMDALHGMHVYVDTPMAIRAAELLGRNPDLLASEPSALARGGRDPMEFQSLHKVFNRRGSLKVAAGTSPAVILAGSGFLDAGPVLHHLASLVSEERHAVIFAGHQLPGSLGHGMLHGARSIELKQGIFEVKMERVHLEGYSGHADRGDLIQWLATREGGSPRVLLNHGEQASREALSATIRERLGLDVESPAPLLPSRI